LKSYGETSSEHHNLVRVPITVCPALKDYRGNQKDYEESLQCIKEKFLEVAIKRVSLLS